MRVSSRRAKQLTDAIESACADMKNAPILHPARDIRGCFTKAVDKEEDLVARELLLYVQRLGVDALQSARDSQYATACQQVTLARRALDSSCGLSAYSRLLVRSMLEPQDAYVAYRCGDPDGALAKMCDAYSAGFELANRYGLTFIAPYRIQLMKNSARLLNELGDGRLSHKLLVAALFYLETDDSQILQRLPSPWSDGWDLGSPPKWYGNKWMLHEEISRQLVDNLCNELTLPEWSLLAEFMGSVSMEVPTQVKRWVSFRFELSSGVNLTDSAISLLSHKCPSQPLILDGLRRIATLIDHQVIT